MNPREGFLQAPSSSLSLSFYTFLFKPLTNLPFKLEYSTTQRARLERDRQYREYTATMADESKPEPVKRALPFKRTVRQNPPNDASAVDDDGLALFSQSKTYFPTVIEDQQKRAREKAEQERQEKLAREQAEAEREARKREERERKRLKAEKKKKKEREERGHRKRRNENDDGDDAFIDRPRKSSKPDTSVGSDLGSHFASGSTRISRSMSKIDLSGTQAPLLVFDSSGDEGTAKKESKDSIISPTRSGGSRTNVTRTGSPKDKVKATDSDSDVPGASEEREGDEAADPLQPYIQAAMERMQKAKEARMAREAAAGEANSNGTPTPGVEDDRGPTVSVMIVAPSLPEAKPLCCTVRTTQALQIAFDTFKERQKVRNKYPHKIISSLIFTWRGDRVYNTTKLETLGIQPLDDDGRLHKSLGGGTPDGYLGNDRVYFETCTPEEYDEHQRKRERERKRQEMGEWWNEDEDAIDETSKAAEAEAQKKKDDEDRVKVIFKARDMPPRNVTLRKHSTVAQMIKAFRKLAGLGEDKHVEIRWDGEVLEPETTVEEADIGDMDSVEVHIR
ncbi:hypothetical protein GGR50DRAFT_667403 [Xylaria sp. CBS 124048]|nr:hypothetical protein GGR50DRAFT_667403 [Xylaria sp. CBS 124048]